MATVIPNRSSLIQEVEDAMHFQQDEEQDRPERSYSESEIENALTSGTLTSDLALHLHVHHINWQCQVRRG